MATDLLAACAGDGSDYDEDPEDANLGGRSIRLASLPPLPKRSPKYRSEPLMGICIVSVLSIMLVSVTQGVNAAASANSSSVVSDEARSQGASIQRVAVALIWAEAGIAVFSMFYLLLGNAGVIHRSEKTCYPIPREVEERLLQRRSLEGLKNIRGPGGSRTMGTIACDVWCGGRRRTTGKSTTATSASVVSAASIIKGPRLRSSLRRVRQVHRGSEYAMLLRDDRDDVLWNGDGHGGCDCQRWCGGQLRALRCGTPTVVAGALAHL
eukprot:CAMPEP_0176177270 /NCGR_PEP_ID=MMETSP0120_2-20121206/90815_1 /TAXON_ID=160619 /ORGANISM="Kryptoperidinium foliaceum, Strain CCMP 1326" /LENGTH=266 /DNA_ID=CAMNT_0017515363 /DNA_START=63 /DNA_END=861 /DNA_ORIENTATION=+